MNFDNLLSGLGKLLPAIGETVIELHPGNALEATKIGLGVNLITAVLSVLHESAVAAQQTAGAAQSTAIPPAAPVADAIPATIQR